MNKKRVERISRMESFLDESQKAIKALKAALDIYESAEDSFYKLKNYYGSVAWMEDYEADEAGRLPVDLKRGVLSEDAVYNLITEHKELMIRLQAVVLESLKEG